MENLTISDTPQPGGGPPVFGGPPPPQLQPHLPAQMFTTAAQLLDLTDKKLMVVLRDGRKIMGVLRSWDQFANLVLQSSVERIFAHPEAKSTPALADAAEQPSSSASDSGRGVFADIPRGTFLVRGENVLLLGEIDLDRDDDPPPGYEKAEVDVVKALIAKRKNETKPKEKTKLRKLATAGFEGENLGEILL